MSRLSTVLSFLAVMAFAVGLSGCNESGDSPPAEPAQQGTAAQPGGAEPAPAEHTGHVHGDSEVEQALCQLPAADRALAEKQKVCPVSGEPLGSMGKPYKVTVKGQDVFLCCRGCEAEINANPDKYLAKLNK